MTIKRIAFIAPSTCLSRRERHLLDRTARSLKRALGAENIFFSPHLFSSDAEIDHVTASVEDRASIFKTAIRESDLVISISGGTGAEDILRELDDEDFRVIRERRPLFIGFSDFTFLLNEIYHACRVPVIYFPSLKLGKGNLQKMLDLIAGDEVLYQGSEWLTAPPPRRFSGIPVGGNFSTFVNFLNRDVPPKFGWKRHILFIEDIHVDVEDLHRMLAALRRHNVFRGLRGIVVGSLNPSGGSPEGRKARAEALRFIRSYLRDVIEERKDRGSPMPILTVSNFGHGIKRNLMAVPIGGRVTISRAKTIAFRIDGGGEPLPDSRPAGTSKPAGPRRTLRPRPRRPADPRR
jgi:muramoyltetrapeptide carboxypeptidase LdcA involved in peptidoglycan recycling